MKEDLKEYVENASIYIHLEIDATVSFGEHTQMIRIYRCAGKRLSYKIVFSPGEEGCSERAPLEGSFWDAGSVLFLDLVNQHLLCEFF